MYGVIMAITISLKTIEFSEFCEGSKKKIVVRLYASELISYLLGWEIPLSPNVRRPKKNSTVQGIVKSIEENPRYEIPSPIHIASQSAQITKGLLRLFLSEPGENNSELGDGVIDGGHKLLSFRTCSITGIKLDKVIVTLFIYVGYCASEIKGLALALNTSSKVDQRTLSNYRGDFDWLKPLLEDYQICYYSGQANVPDDPWCSSDRVFALLMLLNINYNPTSLYASKHPCYLANSGRVVKRQGNNSVKPYVHLIDDIFWLQSVLAKEIDRVANKKAVPFVNFPKDTRHCTHLPTKEILTCNISSKVYSHPMISGFRALLSPDLHWLIDIRKEGSAIIKAMVSRYLDLLALQRYLHRSPESIATDGSIWEEMYKIAYLRLPKSERRLPP